MKIFVTFILRSWILRPKKHIFGCFKNPDQKNFQKTRYFEGSSLYRVELSTIYFYFYIVSTDQRLLKNVKKIQNLLGMASLTIKLHGSSQPSLFIASGRIPLFFFCSETLLCLCPFLCFSLFCKKKMKSKYLHFSITFW